MQLFTKYFLMNGLKWEDYTVILAWVNFKVFSSLEKRDTDNVPQLLLIPFTVLGMVTVISYGASSHQWNITLDQVIHFASLANVIEILYHLTIMTTKIAVLLQYLRIFVPTRNRTFYLTWSLIGVNIIINISLALAFGVQCVPRRKIWTPKLEGRCIDLGAAFIISAVTNTITDISAFLLPLSSIWELQLPRDRKIGVSAVFAVGLFACIASIMRLASSVPLLHTEDFTFYLSKPFLWALAEITSGVICICAPVLPKLFQRLTGRVHTNKGRETPALYGGSNSKRSTLDKGRKPYVELHERDGVGDGTMGESTGKEKFGEEKRWEGDLERGLGEKGSGGRGNGDGNGAIRKTVTIDQTSRMMSK
ncbi:MAG: hypothetical protein LQ352_005733 [Teloschistes flavicans]|nr:MAG: hypothetical protein LQ352_005733 [Teloschistes flavicans]